MRKALLTLGLAFSAAIGAVAAVQAADLDTLKLAIGQRGNWENSPAELGQQAGIFEKHGLKLDILYTQGGGETMQAVLSGSVDIGIGVGTSGILSAFAKGAPVRAIGNSTTGANDLYWYVPGDSPVQSMKDADGKTIAYSSNGSSTNTTVLGLIQEFKVKAEPVATGSPASTWTQTMSGQVDIGWSSPPRGVPELQSGKIRLVARGSDVPSLRNQTVRLMITSAPVLDQKKDQIKRFAEAYAETLDWMYSDPKALEAYAKWVEIPVDVAKETRDQFYPKENLRLNRLSGIDDAMADAVRLKFMAEPLSQDQLDTLIQYPTKPTE
ncbi:ABC transporter substrate-binding protein [Mangrovibrevibacter kandeliae]|uniref:ABC transporter substrate-binding protein n=1 Tax=Mangrovibrevibacter kandeliae TaxID=2968473 RepID=UPI002119812A|nr:ABC transporter substrate-binding protein [Aurantimonas sp. CSK15Z-1]MCQ8783064.1 ABC transporter substrate-binding protein [Aurantimonas sp. CSK15Z-1]